MIAQTARDVARKGEDARVRLEADVAGGELHVRAGVVGDDGRAQAFRRLVVHVGGPDGFSREMALEAVGAGAYAASIPLSRPGTYLAVARDEISGEAVGTTGAVLGAGEELRPTGSDAALLARIAELTGGKKRDTMAGIFADRAVPRFAYEDFTGALLLLAAFGLLLAVAARRLALPAALVTPARPRAGAPPGAPGARARARTSGRPRRCPRSSTRAVAPRPAGARRQRSPRAPAPKAADRAGCTCTARPPGPTARGGPRAAG